MKNTQRNVRIETYIHGHINATAHIRIDDNIHTYIGKYTHIHAYTTAQHTCIHICKVYTHAKYTHIHTCTAKCQKAQHTCIYTCKVYMHTHMHDSTTRQHTYIYICKYGSRQLNGLRIMGTRYILSATVF
jgi:hypothetical protein